MSANGSPVGRDSEDWTLYRHKHDSSVLYEVRPTEPRTGPLSEESAERYEVRRIDNPEVFGSEAFVVDAAEFEQTYEPENE